MLTGWGALCSRATAGDCLESSYFKEKPLRECPDPSTARVGGQDGAPQSPKLEAGHGSQCRAITRAVGPGQVGAGCWPYTPSEGHGRGAGGGPRGSDSPVLTAPPHSLRAGAHAHFPPPPQQAGCPGHIREPEQALQALRASGTDQPLQLAALRPAPSAHHRPGTAGRGREVTAGHTREGLGI